MNSKMIRLGEFKLREVLPYSGPYVKPREYVDNYGKSHLINMNSKRYRVFSADHRCAFCGIEGIKMILEKHCQKIRRPHFNMYAEEEGELILMNVDHILPRSKGGSNQISNLQTMCYQCNSFKSNHKWNLNKFNYNSQYFHIFNKYCSVKCAKYYTLQRSLFDGGISLPKEFTLAAKEAQNKLKKGDPLLVSCDGYLVNIDGNHQFKSFNESKSANVIRNVIKGETIFPVSYFKGKLFVRDENDNHFIISQSQAKSIKL